MRWKSLQDNLRSSSIKRLSNLSRMILDEVEYRQPGDWCTLRFRIAVWTFAKRSQIPDATLKQRKKQLLPERCVFLSTPETLYSHTEELDVAWKRKTRSINNQTINRQTIKSAGRLLWGSLTDAMQERWFHWLISSFVLTMPHVKSPQLQIHMHHRTHTNSI